MSNQKLSAKAGQLHVVNDAQSSTIPGDDGIQSGYSLSGGTYAWGPTGKLRTVSITNGACITDGPFTLHWDGDALLFITSSKGALVQLSVEKLGGQIMGCSYKYPLSQFTILDRDFSGTQVAYHNANVDSPWIILPQRSSQLGKSMVTTHSPFTCVGCSTTGSYGFPDFSISQIFNSVREDGYLVGNLNIQGVRAYDPTTSQWSTPDAYKGDVHDPLSQRSYMWNRNNPVEYSDPTGYFADAIPWVFTAAGGAVCWECAVAAAAITGLSTVGWNLHEQAKNDKDAPTPNAGPGPNDGTQIEESKTPTNQVEAKIRRGQAPDVIEGAHKGKVYGEKDHIHVNDGAINSDGTIKHELKRPLTRKQESWINTQRWKVPQ